MRTLYLTPGFKRDRGLYATDPQEDEAVDAALRLLTLAALSSNDTLPLLGDEIDFASAYATIWAHVLPTVKLVITYAIMPEQLGVWTLRRNLRPA